MKRTIIILAVIAIACTCSSCQKEREGVYHPKKKIVEIYEQSDPYGYAYNGIKRLTEKWTWNGKNLSKITSADESVYCLFKYEKNRISKIEGNDGFYGAYSPYTLSFTYEGDFIKKIECHDKRGLYAVFDFKHTQNKITTMTITINDNLSFKNTVAAFRLFLPVQTVKSILNEEQSASLSKGETRTSVFEFEWDGDNIKTETLSYEREHYSSTSKTTYQYDDKINPFYNSTRGFVHSKNNVISAKTDMRTIEYKITYDGQFPVEISENLIIENNSYPINIYYYVYKK